MQATAHLQHIIKLIQPAIHTHASLPSALLSFVFDATATLATLPRAQASSLSRALLWKCQQELPQSHMARLSFARYNQHSTAQPTNSQAILLNSRLAAVAALSR